MNAQFNLLLVISHKIPTATSILPIIRENVMEGNDSGKRYLSYFCRFTNTHDLVHIFLEVLPES